MDETKYEKPLLKNSKRIQEYKLSDEVSKQCISGVLKNLPESEWLLYYKLKKCVACRVTKEYGQDDCYFCSNCERIYHECF